MATSWKAYTCVLFLSSVPLFIFSAFWLSRPLSAMSGALFALCYAWVLSQYTIPFFSSTLKGIPEPSDQSLFLAHGMAIFAQPPGSAFLKFLKTTPNNGIILVRGFFHRKNILLLTSPEALKEVLNDKSYDWEKQVQPRRFLERIVGNGVLVSEGQEHKKQRKAVTPAFHGSHIKNLIPLFWEKANQFTKVLSDQLASSTSGGSREGTVDIHNFTPRVTLDIIGLAGLGRDFNTLENDDDVLAKSFARITDTENPEMIRYFMACMLLPDWFRQVVPWKVIRIFAEITKTMRDAAVKLVEEKKVATFEKADTHVDILSVMLKQSVPFTDATITDQLLTFLAAGSETTASALIWLTYLLSKYPDIQEQLRAEIKKALDDSDGDGKPDIGLIDSLPLLSAVCNETLRVYPTVPLTSRVCVKPTSILGIEIPVDTEIIICPWAIHRSPTLWGDNAEEWKPERWLGEGNATTGGAKHTFSFLTFLHGPRSCIGQGFARSELKYLVAAMVLKFHIELADKDEIPMPAGAITIKPKHGLKLRLREL